jgi:hypothetical protein
VKVSDGMQLFFIFLFEVVIFCIINFLTISLSQNNFKRRVVAGILFLLLTPIFFFITLTFASIFDKGGFGAATLTSIFAGIYILNGIAILLSSTFIIKKT